MASISININFNGNCEQAFNFYRSVFGGEFIRMMRFKEMPGDTKITGPAGEKIMHMELPIGKSSLILGSDVPESMGPVTSGTNFTMTILAESEEEATKLFNALSAGGKITMPLAKSFWGALFGMFTDQFGIQWMVNYDYPKN